VAVLQGCAVGLLTGAAAWCFDEPAAAVVDTAPRSLLWRTGARADGLLFLLVWWGLTVALSHPDLFGRAADVTPAAAFLALSRLFADRVPVFPYTSAGQWAQSRALWTVVRAGVGHLPRRGAVGAAMGPVGLQRRAGRRGEDRCDAGSRSPRGLQRYGL